MVELPYCIWCGTGPTVSALGVAPDGLEDKAAEARRSRPEWPAESAANTGNDCGSGPIDQEHHLIRIDGPKSAVLNT